MEMITAAAPPPINTGAFNQDLPPATSPVFEGGPGSGGPTGPDILAKTGGRIHRGFPGFRREMRRPSASLTSLLEALRDLALPPPLPRLFRALSLQPRPFRSRPPLPPLPTDRRVAPGPLRPVRPGTRAEAERPTRSSNGPRPLPALRGRLSPDPARPSRPPRPSPPGDAPRREVGRRERPGRHPRPVAGGGVSVGTGQPGAGGCDHPRPPEPLPSAPSRAPPRRGTRRGAGARASATSLVAPHPPPGPPPDAARRGGAATGSARLVPVLDETRPTAARFDRVARGRCGDHRRDPAGVCGCARDGRSPAGGRGGADLRPIALALIEVRRERNTGDGATTGARIGGSGSRRNERFGRRSYRFVFTPTT